jgi:PPOX class probable F420-dependent enzyme
VDTRTARDRLSSARVGHLATVSATHRPHVVPCCFVLDSDTLYSAVDAKPKTTMALQRLENIRSNGAVSLLVDHYEEDWTRLWWVRVDGTAAVAGETERQVAIDLLSAKYEQYRSSPPPGPVVAIAIERWRMWP